MDYHAGTPALYIKIIFSHRKSRDTIPSSFEHNNCSMFIVDKYRKQGNIFRIITLSQPNDCLPSCSADAMYIIRVYPDSRVTVMRGANPN